MSLIHDSLSGGRPIIVLAAYPQMWYWYPVSGAHWVVIAGAYTNDHNESWIILHCSSYYSHNGAVTGSKNGKYHISLSDFISSLRGSSFIYYGIHRNAPIPQSINSHGIDDENYDDIFEGQY